MKQITYPLMYLLLIYLIISHILFRKLCTFFLNFPFDLQFELWKYYFTIIQFKNLWEQIQKRVRVQYQVLWFSQCLNSYQALYWISLILLKIFDWLFSISESVYYHTLFTINLKLTLFLKEFDLVLPSRYWNNCHFQEALPNEISLLK